MYKIEITKYVQKTRTVNDKRVTIESTGGIHGDSKYKLLDPFEEEYTQSSNVLSQTVEDMDITKVIKAINGID